MSAENSKIVLINIILVKICQKRSEALYIVFEPGLVENPHPVTGAYGIAGEYKIFVLYEEYNRAWSVSRHLQTLHLHASKRERMPLIINI